MATVLIQPNYIFGLRTGVTNNLCFFDEQTVVFPCGNNCVRYNINLGSQKLIPGTERSQGMQALAISANRRYLAVAERGEKASVTVYDLQHEQGRKRKVLSADDNNIQEFVCLAFSPDSKFLIGQAGAPEWTLTLWLWEKQKVMATVKSSSSNNPVTQVSFSPHNNTQMCVSGAGVFKLFRYSEGTLKLTNSPKVDSINLLCHAWAAETRVIAGSDTGRLLVFESGYLQTEMEKVEDGEEGESPVAACVTAILSYSKGLICSTGPGTVCLFEKTEEDGYRKTKEIRIRPDPCSEDPAQAELQQISTVCVSPSEETLAVSTEEGQLYSISLSSVETSKGEQVHFEFLSHSFHSKPITGLSTCIRKPLVATCSLDCSVRIWNYQGKTLELHKGFGEEAYSVALHPSGLFILVGFTDKLRMMNLLIDDIRTINEFSVRGCRECAFSHGGHLFAAVNGNVIHIYSVTTFENVLNLKGHRGKVQSVRWSLDDSRLVSCGMDGAVYEWNTHTGRRESECVLKSCNYTDVAFSPDARAVVAVGTDHTLKLIQDCQVLREVLVDDVTLTTITSSRSGRVVFTGTSSGTVRAIKFPLPLQKDWMEYQAHCGPITKMVITCDDQFLLTVSEDGCLLLWNIIDKEAHTLRTDRRTIFTDEILITKSDLEEKNQNMQELKARVEELKMENEYQLRLRDMKYNERIKELSETFSQQVESLQTTIQVCLPPPPAEYLSPTCSKHLDQALSLTQNYGSQKQLLQHEQYQELQHQSHVMQEEYERQLVEVEERRERGLEELMQLHEAQLQEKTQLLQQCQDEVRKQTREYEAIIKQTEEDCDWEVTSVRFEYTRKLETEQETNLSLKGETGIMKKKFESQQKELEDRRSVINEQKQKLQQLQALISSLEGDILDLKRQISELKKGMEMKDNVVAELNENNQMLSRLRFILNLNITHLQQQIQPRENSIREMKELNQQVSMEMEVEKFHKESVQLEQSVSDLKLRLKAVEQELHRERQRGKDLQTYVKRLKTEIHNCVAVIQEPKKLKDSVRGLYARHVQHADVDVETAREDAAIQREFGQQREYLEKSIAALKLKLDEATTDHEKQKTKILKENVLLITEINELRKELETAKTHIHSYQTRLALSNKSSKPEKSKKQSPADCRGERNII
uniref:Cilia and flagella associated protein 57 n=1 Tax=Myripristis murdjan TaxID=586833 RepID=A0A667XCB5_9TELE